MNLRLRPKTISIFHSSAKLIFCVHVETFQIGVSFRRFACNRPRYPPNIPPAHPLTE